MSYPRPLIVLMFVLALAPSLRGDPPALSTFRSDHYTVRTDLPREQAAPLGRHMDQVFQAYARRFAEFEPGRRTQMPLYLLSREQPFLDLMASFGIDATHSGGMAFVKNDHEGLAAWIGDRPMAEVLATLQHEGFHQFAHIYLGELPIWANEGLAEYFGEGLLEDGELRLGLRPPRRVKLLHHAMERGELVSFDQMLTMTDEAWGQVLRRDPARADLYYTQAWSMVYFLIHGEGGKFREAFDRYLRMISAGRASEAAFNRAFGQGSIEPFERRWRQFVEALEPDPLLEAVHRLEFLGRGLKWLRENEQAMPQNIEALERALARVSFQLTTRSYDLKFVDEAGDPAMYRYSVDGQTRRFEVRPQEGAPLPKVVAPGLEPSPTLWWDRVEGQWRARVTLGEPG